MDNKNLEHFPPQEQYVEQSIPEVAGSETQNPEPQVQAVQEETSAARNFRNLREKAERLERERDDAVRYAQSLQAQKHNTTNDDIDLADDDLVERKHVDKIMQSYKDGRLNQYETAYQEQLVLNQCKDFHQVVTQDAVDKLMLEEPEIAAALSAQPDIRSKAIATYNIIKKLGYNESKAPYSQDIERAQRNATKPRPLASVNPQQGDSPLSKANAFANGLTPELQEQLRKEMNSARRGY